MDNLENPAEDFFVRFFRRFPLSHAPDFFDTVLDLAEELTYATPVAALVALKEKESINLLRSIKETPFPPEGKWLTIEEIEKIGLGYTATDLESILIQKHAPEFTSRERNVSPSLPCQEYFITYENLALIDKQGLKSALWAKNYQHFRYVLAQLQSASKMLENLEARCSEKHPILSHPTLPEPLPPQHSYPTPPHQEQVLSKDNLPEQPASFVEMTVRELKSAGSKYHPVYLAIRINKNQIKWNAQKEGKSWRVTVTPENYELLGLQTMPPRNHVLPLHPKNPPQQDLETRTKDSLSTTPHEESTTSILDQNNSPSIKPSQDSFRTLSSYDLNAAKGEIIHAELGSHIIPFSTTTQYATFKVKEFLGMIHPEVFTDECIGNALNLLQGTDKYVPGSTLVPFIKRTAGMMLLDTSSTRNRLGDLLNMHYTEIEKAFAQPPLNQFVHRYNEITLRPYILKRELKEMKQIYEEYQKSFSPGIS